MGLFKKIFSGDKPAQADPSPSSQFHDSESDGDTGTESRNAPRRELIHIVLRDTMRQHGIPSDWIDCRVLSDAGNRTRAGMHVQLIVRHGHDRMLTYVPAFQGSFMQGLAKFEPRASDWLLSLAWEFDGLDTSGKFPAMPDPASWSPAAPPAPPAPTPAALAAAAAAAQEDDDVSQDLKALFAIRDAAIRDDRADGHVDFQPTQPGT